MPARRDPFLRLWAATGVSNLGDGIGLVAVPLLAASLTRDPLLVGTVSAVAYLPYLLLAIPIGVLVDQVERRRAMVVANLVRVALLGGLVVGVVTDTARIWWLFVVAFGFATAECVYDNAAEAVIVDIVEPERLDQANSRLQTTMHVTNMFAGGPLGAFLFAIAAAVPFGVQAVGHLMAAGFVAGLPGRDPEPGPEEGRRQLAAAWVSLREGLGWLVRHRDLRSLAVVSGVMSLATQIAQVTIVLFVLDELDESEFVFGLLSMTAAVGAITGSAVAPWVSERFGRRSAMLAGNVIQPFVIVAIGLAPNALAVGLLYIVFSGLIGMWNVLSVSYRQHLVPTRLYGRVLGAWRTVVWGSVPIGAWVGGVVARRAGLRAPWYVGAAVFAVGTVLSWPALRRAADDQSGVNVASSASTL